MIDNDLHHATHCQLCRRPRAELRVLLTRLFRDPINDALLVVGAICDECTLTAFASLSYGMHFMQTDCRNDRIRGGYNSCPECGARDGESCREGCAIRGRALDPMGGV